MQLFAYSWKLPAYSGAFLLSVDNFSFFTYSGAFLLTVLAFLLTVGVFFAYSGKLRLIRALRDCKQRSLTVSKKTPTVSQKASPVMNSKVRARQKRKRARSSASYLIKLLPLQKCETQRPKTHRHFFWDAVFLLTVGSFLLTVELFWETDFYTPPVLGGAVLLPFSAPAVY